MAQQPLRGFTITLRNTTLGWTPLDEWSALFRDHYLTKLNTHNTETSMPLAGFQPTIPASERPQPPDGAATGTGLETYYHINNDQPLDSTRANWIKFTVLNPTYLKCTAIFSSHLHLRPPSCFGTNAFCEWICMTNTSYACLPCMLHVPHFPVFFF